MKVQRELLARIKLYLASKQAIVITGMRRVGKTTLLQSIFENTKSDNKLFIDLENVLNRALFEETDYEAIKDTFSRQGIDFTRQAFIFLDEIQFARNIPSIVKYLYDHNNIKFFLTGSASFYLKNFFSESMAGRKYIFELFPFTFQEFLALKQRNITIPKQGEPVTEPIFITLQNAYEEYRAWGGFPEVAAAGSEEEKKRLLEEIVTSYIQLEVLQLSDFRKIDIIRDLIILLCDRVGNLLDITKISSELGVARETVREYISFLEGTYMVSLIRPFSRNKGVEIRKTPKLYLCDSGLANHLGRIAKGALFEQTVFQQLRAHIEGDIQFYRRKRGMEIDFVCEKKYAYEVKQTPGAQDGRRLQALAQEIGLDKGEIVSGKYTNFSNCIYGFQL